MPAAMNANRIIAIIVAIFAVAYLVVAYDIRQFPIPRPIDSDVVPKVLGYLMLGLAAVLFFERPAAKDPEDAAHPAPAAAPPVAPLFERPWVQVALTILGVAAYAALLRPFGFVIASALLVGGLAALYGYRAWTINGVVSIAVPLFLYLALTRGMAVNLPRGPLPF